MKKDKMRNRSFQMMKRKKNLKLNLKTFQEKLQQISNRKDQFNN